MLASPARPAVGLQGIIEAPDAVHFSPFKPARHSSMHAVMARRVSPASLPQRPLAKELLHRDRSLVPFELAEHSIGRMYVPPHARQPLMHRAATGAGKRLNGSPSPPRRSSMESPSMESRLPFTKVPTPAFGRGTPSLSYSNHFAAESPMAVSWATPVSALRPRKLEPLGLPLVPQRQMPRLLALCASKRPFAAPPALAEKGPAVQPPTLLSLPPRDSFQ